MSPTEYMLENEAILLNEYRSGKFTFSSLAKKHNLDRSNFCRFMKRRGCKKSLYRKHIQKYSILDDFFEKIDNEEKAYFLGFLFADGYNNIKRGDINLRVSVIDKDIVFKFRSALGSNHPIRFIESNGFKNSQQIGLYICNKKISTDLEKNGCGKNKTHSCSFPLIQSALVKHFIRGYFDGDGSLSFTSQKENYKAWLVNICVNDAFGLELSNIINSQLPINLAFYPKREKQKNNISYCCLGGSKQVEILMDWLYSDCKVYLDRKYNKYLELKNDRDYMRNSGRST